MMAENSYVGNNNHESLEIIKLFHEDFIYRHTNYWHLVYKSMLSILGLMSLPYFLHDRLDNIFLIIFPILSFIVSIFSIILLESEAVRMNSSREKRNDLLQNVSPLYQEKTVDTLFKKNRRNNISVYSKLLKWKITKKILFLYCILIGISIAYFILILTDKLF